MHFTDTHCHIHDTDYPLDKTEVLHHAAQSGVDRLICVGTTVKSSQQAVEFANNHDNVWASLGIHPHEAKEPNETVENLKSLLGSSKIVAIGECGLDYFYNHSPKEAQISLLKTQIELALDHNLPLIFHVRDAFDDFWPIFDSYQGIRGVLHSFTDNKENLDKAVKRGLFIGVNGISTFTKVEAQIEMFKNIPLGHLLLETDAPFLTPTPKRGTINEPAFVTLVAQYLTDLQHTSLQELSGATTQNATQLFKLK